MLDTAVNCTYTRSLFPGRGTRENTEDIVGRSVTYPQIQIAAGEGFLGLSVGADFALWRRSGLHRQKRMPAIPWNIVHARETIHVVDSGSNGSVGHAVSLTTDTEGVDVGTVRNVEKS